MLYPSEPQNFYLLVEFVFFDQHFPISPSSRRSPLRSGFCNMFYYWIKKSLTYFQVVVHVLHLDIILLSFPLLFFLLIFGQIYCNLFPYFQSLNLWLFQGHVILCVFLVYSTLWFFSFFPICSLSFNMQNQCICVYCVNWYIWFPYCLLSSTL